MMKTKDGFITVPEFDQMANGSIALNDVLSEGFAASIGRELLLPIKEIIDYKGFAQRILRKYTLNGWAPHTINGHEVWASWG